MYNRKITTQVSMDKNGMFEIYEIDETEYQKQPTMEDKTLNERINEVLFSWTKEGEKPKRISDEMENLSFLK